LDWVFVWVFGAVVNRSELEVPFVDLGSAPPSNAYYAGFQTKADRVKNDFLAFLLDAKRAGKKVAAYGAAAKGNTLLNYAGVRPDLLPYVVDGNPAKQGKSLPGSRIPIVAKNDLGTIGQTM
jgi:hypothetical protein